MTLQWTTIELPLGAGLDTKTNEKLVKPPQAIELENAVFPSSGVSGYETRKGYEKVISSDNPIATVVPRENELSVISNNKFYSISELPNNVELKEKGNLLSTGVIQENLDSKNKNQTQSNYVSLGDLELYTYYDGTSTFYTVRHLGTEVLSDIELEGISGAIATSLDNTVLIVYPDGVSLKCIGIPTYNPEATFTTELRGDYAGPFDVTAAGDRLFCAYTDASNLTKAFSITSAGNSSALALVTSEASTSITVTSDQEVVSTTATTITYSSLPDLVLGTQTVYNVSDCRRATFLNGVFYCEFPDPDARSDQFATVEIGSNPEELTTVIQHSILASHPFTIDGTDYVHVQHVSPLQSTYFLLDSSGDVQAKCCNGIAQGSNTDALPRVIDNKWAPVFREKLQIDLNPDEGPDIEDIFSQFGLKLVTYDTDYSPNTVQYGRSAYIQSGILWGYDGSSLYEQGFNIYPETIEATPSSGGELSANKTYNYRVYYEWTNARGERQRSTTAQVISKELSSETKITLQIPSLGLTNKPDVAIVVYRTEGDANIIGGAPFYRCSDPNPSNTTGDNAYILNDKTTDTIEFIDVLSDTDLRGRELDYLNSGELDHVSPSASNVIGESKNRVWLSGFENQSMVQYSKLNSRGRDQLEFHDTSTIQLPEEGGPITAIAALNFHTLIFKENSCYVVSGEGPNNLGQGFFNLPQIVSLDVGCIEQRSVINIPYGVMFKSNKGIWVVSHNLQTEYIGGPVERYNNQDITSAVMVQAENHVIFTTSSGSTLVYNYLMNAWSTFTNHEGSHACTWAGTYTYARNDGRVYRQNDSYADDGVRYSMRFLTAPISVKGVQGTQHIRHIKLLGEYYSPHILRVGCKYDHKPGISHTATWDPRESVNIDNYGDSFYGDGAYGGTGNPVYQCRFNLPIQKCQVVQFEIDSKYVELAGRAMSIQAIQIEVGAMRDTGELSVDRSFTSGSESATVSV